MKTRKQSLFRLLFAGVAVVACVSAMPAAASATGITAQPNAYGQYMADSYQTNVNTHLTPQSNSAIAVLDRFSQLWKPGTAWNNGTALNAAVLDSNIAQAIQTTTQRTPAQATAAYLYDRRNQSYSALEGFGPLTATVCAASNAGTTISNAIPANATTILYNDTGNSNGSWADTTSKLGKMVQLVNTLRGNYSSANNAKAYFNYPRPWRQNSKVVIVPQLVPAKSSNPSTDGGFPSGHTNAVYLADFALAYAYPQRFQQFLTQASTVGNSRIVAGMHSPLDVMGGRMLATALASSILNDPVNTSLAAAAYAQTQNVLAGAKTSNTPSQAQYAAGRAQYRQHLTYGFTQIGSTTIPASVPKGTEALLRTRFPYLTTSQIREVLRTTALPSGYPLLDDTEGWGRLDLYSAASGYGAFDNAVTATLNAAAGGFSASDIWRNDIAGTGSLTKAGTGSLSLTGMNTYSGGTTVNGGTLAAGSASALGSGVVSLARGTLSNTSISTVNVEALTQAVNSTINLSVLNSGPAFAAKGMANLHGNLIVNVAPNVRLANDVVLISAADITSNSAFQNVAFHNLPAGYNGAIEIRGGAVHLVNRAAIGNNNQATAPTIKGQLAATGSNTTGISVIAFAVAGIGLGLLLALYRHRSSQH